MSEIDRIIGRNIRMARKKAGLTQEQAAELLRISPIQYGRYERGERSVSLARLCAIAETMGASMASLLEGCTPAAADGWPQELSAHQREMLAMAAALPEPAQEMIHRIYLFLRAEGGFPPISS